MQPKKLNETKKEKSIEVQQVNPVTRRIQTEEGWKRGMIKSKNKSKG